MRKKYPLLAVTTALCLLVAGSAWSRGEIYRWVDEDGVVHYSQVAPEGVEATVVGVRPNAVPSVSAPPVRKSASGGNAEPGAGEDISYAEQRRRDRADRWQEQLEKNAKMARECDVMRKQKALLEPNPRVMIQGEDGTVQRLDDEKRLSALEEANAFLAANCND